MIDIILAKVLDGFLGKVIDMLFDSIKINGLEKFFQYKTKYKETEIRLSVAYLIRIKATKNKYLLVKNSKIPNQFQPVGGVYKYNDLGKEFLREINFRQDDGYIVTENSLNDLRIRIKGKYVSRFITWFKAKKGREVTAYREFKEELIDSNILDSNIFNESNVRLDYKRRSIGKLKFSDHFQCEEILIRDIYEFIPNESQQRAIDALKDETDLYKFFTYEEINRLGKISDCKEYRIGEHTKSILEGSEF